MPMVGLGVYNISERGTRLPDTGRNVTDGPSEALKYNTESI